MALGKTISARYRSSSRIRATAAPPRSGSLHSRDSNVEGRQDRKVPSERHAPALGGRSMQGRDQVGHQRRLIDTGRCKAHLDALRLTVFRIEPVEAPGPASTIKQSWVRGNDADAQPADSWRLVDHVASCQQDAGAHASAAYPGWRSTRKNHSSAPQAPVPHHRTGLRPEPHEWSPLVGRYAIIS